MAEKSDTEPRDLAWRRGSGDSEGDLVEAARHRVSLPFQRRELSGELLAGVTFLAAAIGLMLVSPPQGGEPLMGLALVLAYALARQIRFEVGAGFAVPTQLALVAMLVLLPASIVPLLVLAGTVLGEVPGYLSGKRHPQRALAAFGSSWHAMGPALVLVAAGTPEPALRHWPVYAAALLAQLAFELAARAGREWYAYGVPPRGQVAGAAWIWAVDGLLSPIALVAAITMAEAELLLLVLLPLFGLLALLAHERRGRLEQALTLRNAYLGTTILLADLIEADDEQTGPHSQGVVALSVDVADELQLDAWQRRRTEYAARLHDVGKIAVPKEIINKPGPLDPTEWKLMREHTVEGERMLSEVGGALREVGAIVRGTHERWDGAGYPDGLAGADIPLEARIVACCDAFDAMTTDRAYRMALSTEAALNEIRRGSSTQFDPDVASALIRVVLRREAEREAAQPGTWRPRRRAPAG